MQLRLSTVNLLIVCSFGLYTGLNHFSHKKNSFASVFGRHSYNGFKTTPTLRNNYPILFAALPDIICGITNTICGITRYDLRHYPILFAALSDTIQVLRSTLYSSPDLISIYEYLTTGLAIKCIYTFCFYRYLR